MPNQVVKPFVFVLMPFNEKFDDVYKLGIKPACTDVGTYCERVDEQHFDGSILDRIYNQIAKADLIISDMTGQNPNVFYETGYAHALGKRVFLVTSNADDIPFDLKHYPHIVYDNISTLKEQLGTKVQWAVENKDKSLSRLSFPLVPFSAGRKITRGAWIEVRKVITSPSDYVVVNIDFHNPTELVFETPACIGLAVPEYYSSSNHKTARLEDGRFLHFHEVNSKVFPKGWLPIQWRLNTNRIEKEVHQIELHVYTETQNHTCPLMLNVT